MSKLGQHTSGCPSSACCGRGDLRPPPGPPRGSTAGLLVAADTTPEGVYPTVRAAVQAAQHPRTPPIQRHRAAAMLVDHGVLDQASTRRLRLLRLRASARGWTGEGGPSMGVLLIGRIPTSERGGVRLRGVNTAAGTAGCSAGIQRSPDRWVWSIRVRDELVPADQGRAGQGGADRGAQVCPRRAKTRLAGLSPCSGSALVFAESPAMEGANPYRRLHPDEQP